MVVLYTEIDYSDYPFIFQWIFKTLKEPFPDETEIRRFLQVNNYEIISRKVSFLFGIDVELFLSREIFHKDWNEERKKEDALSFSEKFDVLMNASDHYEVFDKYLKLDVGESFLREYFPTYSQWNDCILKALKTPHYMFWFRYRSSKLLAKSRDQKIDASQPTENKEGWDT